MGNETLFASKRNDGVMPAGTRYCKTIYLRFWRYGSETAWAKEMVDLDAFSTLLHRYHTTPPILSGQLFSYSAKRRPKGPSMRLPLKRASSTGTTFIGSPCASNERPLALGRPKTLNPRLHRL